MSLFVWKSTHEQYYNKHYGTTDKYTTLSFQFKLWLIATLA